MQTKMDLWSFDLIFEPLSWWKIAHTTNQENQLKSPSIQVNKDAHDKDKKFFAEDYFSSARVDQQTGWQYWPSSPSSSWWHESEWSWKWAHNFFCSNLFFVTVGFVYSWYRSTVTDAGSEQNTLTARILAHLHTFHPCSHAPHGFVLTSSPLSCVSTFCSFSSSPLSWSSSSMWSESPSTKSTADPHKEGYCPVEIHNPLTGY